MPLKKQIECIFLITKLNTSHGINKKNNSHYESNSHFSHNDAQHTNNKTSECRIHLLLSIIPIIFFSSTILSIRLKQSGGKITIIMF